MVRAEWHTDLVVPVDDDPFAPSVEHVGAPIVLSADGERAELQRALAVSLVRENELAEQGRTCRIKDSAESICHACPLFDVTDPLCVIGREQETITTRLLVLHHGGRR